MPNAKKRRKSTFSDDFWKRRSKIRNHEGFRRDFDREDYQGEIFKKNYRVIANNKKPPKISLFLSLMFWVSILAVILSILILFVFPISNPRWQAIVITAMTIIIVLTGSIYLIGFILIDNE